MLLLDSCMGLRRGSSTVFPRSKVGPWLKVQPETRQMLHHGTSAFKHRTQGSMQLHLSDFVNSCGCGAKQEKQSKQNFEAGARPTNGLASGADITYEDVLKHSKAKSWAQSGD